MTWLIARLAGRRVERYFLSNLVANPAESTIAISHLIFGGVLDRFPDLKVCVVHGGGVLPYPVGRLERGWVVASESAALATVGASVVREAISLGRGAVCGFVRPSHEVDSLVEELGGCLRAVLRSVLCGPLAPALRRVAAELRGIEEMPAHEF